MCSQTLVETTARISVAAVSSEGEGLTGVIVEITYEEPPLRLGL